VNNLLPFLLFFFSVLSRSEFSVSFVASLACDEMKSRLEDVQPTKEATTP
jgi:hypothetical protein